MNEQSSLLRNILIALGAITVLVILILGLRWTIGRFRGNGTEATMTQISFQTTDNVTIVGDLYRPEGAILGGAILVPMMPATKESWQNFANELTTRGYLALAIDLRGHGESTKQGMTTLDYQKFSSTDHQKSHLDLEAALEYLMTTEKLSSSQIGLVGASIGANLSLQVMAKNRQILWGVFLSPGLDYHGIRSQPLIEHLSAPQRILLVASDDDAYSHQTVNQLSRISPAPTTTHQLANAGHGTTMFERDPELQTQVIDWITRNTLKLTGPQ